MAAENWQQVRDIFDVALRQRPEERSNYVNEACSGDKALVAEVESLLTSFDSSDDFMETPAIANVARQEMAEKLQFTAGQLLNHYKIIRPLGAGGMGEVYLAIDTKLNRQVALKVLHPALFSDNQSNRRLLREAQAAAKLDHPNICAIHEISETDDVSFIVMQYVEGETLADVLAERLSVEKSLDLAIQITSALSEAHSHGIIHRDIKPANIIVNEKGHAKVLDFGLAKFIESENLQDTVDRLHSSGAVMGTVPYMSPEQLCGKNLDARSDIFSFGAMFYEMLSGRQAFAQDSNAETISAILNDQPEWTGIPAPLLPIVQKSLKKDREERDQTAQDLTNELIEARRTGEFLQDSDAELSERNRTDAISTSTYNRTSPRETDGARLPSYRFWKNAVSSAQPATGTDPSGKQRSLPARTFRFGYPTMFAIVILLLMGTAGWLAWQLYKADDLHSFDDLRSVQLVSWKAAAGTNSGDYRISPDGKMIAYSSSEEGPGEAIFVKQTADGAQIRVTRDEWGSVSPLWSPNSQRIAYASFRNNRSGIYWIPALGGNETTLKVVDNTNVRLVHWSRDEAAIFYESGGNLFRLDIATRETEQVTTSSGMKYFSISPDETEIAYVAKTDGQPDLWMSSLKNESPVRLTDDKEAEVQPRWHPDGKRILYTVTRNNYDQINVAYTDRRPPQQVTRGDSDSTMIDVSSDGTKVYYFSKENRSDVWGVATQTGEEFEIAASIESEYWPDISPDGKSIAHQITPVAEFISTLHDPKITVRSLTGQFPPLTLKGYNPRWLPDSRRIAVLRWPAADQNRDLWLVDTTNGEERKISTAHVIGPGYSMLPYNRAEAIVWSWTPDSRNVAYLARESGALNILTTSLESGQTIDFTNNTNPNLVYSVPAWSTDGIRIAFTSQEKPDAPDQKTIFKVWIVEEGKPKEIYSTTAQLRLLGWSAEGDLVWEESDAPMTRPMDIRLVRISITGKKRSETALQNVYATSMSLSADGKLVTFTARQDNKDNIWLARAIGGGLRKITTNGNSRLFLGSPTLSPDGKTIFFDKQEETKIISRLENF